MVKEIIETVKELMRNRKQFLKDVYSVKSWFDDYVKTGNLVPPKDDNYDLGSKDRQWKKIYGGTIAANKAVIDPSGTVHTTELTDTNDFETESGTFNRDSPSAGTTSITLNNTYDPSCFIASIGIESGGTSATYDQAIGSGIRSYDTNANGNITGVTFYVVFVLSGGGTATFRWDAMGRTV